MGNLVTMPHDRQEDGGLTGSGDVGGDHLIGIISKELD